MIFQNFSRKFNFNICLKLRIFINIFLQFLLRMRNISVERIRENLYTHFTPDNTFHTLVPLIDNYNTTTYNIAINNTVKLLELARKYYQYPVVYRLVKHGL